MFLFSMFSMKKCIIPTNLLTKIKIELVSLKVITDVSISMIFFKLIFCLL